ncbi:MAG: hypothetical protein ACFFC7_14815 [Candidatus Hermodarchaeota archaeon]
MRIPIESLESKFIAYHHVRAVDIHGWFVLDSRLDLETLSKAIKAVCKEFPILTSRVIDLWSHPYYKTLQALPSLYHSSIDWNNIYEVPKEFFSIFEEKIDVYQGPLVKFFYFESKSQKYTIFGIKFNHCVADGLGGLRILDLVAEYYTAFLEKRQIERPVGRTDRNLELIYQRFPTKIMQRLKKDFLRAVIDFFLLTRHPDKLLNCEAADQITITPIYFFESDTKQIKAFARQNNASFNDLLTAAIAWTYYRWNGRIKRFRILIPQDLRFYAQNMRGIPLDHGYWLPVANIVGVFYLDILGKDFKTKEELLRIVQQKTHFAKETHQGLANLSYLGQNVTQVPIPLFRRIFSKIGIKKFGKFIRSSALFTNGGAIPSGRFNFGNAKPVLFSAVLPPIPGLPVVVTATGMKNSISLILTHNKHGFDKNRFISYLKEFLLNENK